MAEEQLTDAERERRQRQVETLSSVLDSKFRIPGTQIRFGVDAVLGIVPGIGDSIGLIASAAVISQAIGLGARGFTLARMFANVGVDALVGSIPLLGTLFDVVFRANERNVRLLARHVDDPLAAKQRSKALLIAIPVAMVLVWLSIVVAVSAAIYAIVR